MELLELVSSHVTVPVIGVVLCALMVFTFGFRSSAQPPNFTFEEHPEKKNKKRSKQTKIKSSPYGNVKTTDSSGHTPKATSESPKAGPALPSKPKSEIRKEASQDLKGEKKLKVKKEGKGGVKTQNLQANNNAPVKKETEEEGEWTTIQMSKKSKKPKPSKKESSAQAEPVLEAQHESDTTPEVEVAAIADISPISVSAPTADAPAVITVSAAVTADSPAIEAFPAAVTADPSAVVAEVPTSPESNRNRNKKRKEKVAEKKPAEKEQDAQTEAVDIKPVTVESSRPQSEERGISKKKNKKDKKPVGEVPASVSETGISSEHLAAGQKEVDQTLTQSDAPELPSLEQTKPDKKKKKNAGKEIVQKEAHQTAPDMQIRQQEKSVAAANNSVSLAPSKAVKPEDVESDVSSSEQPQPSSVTASPPLVGISFDEIGDPWVDAAPKSKKKKARRDN